MTIIKKQGLGTWISLVVIVLSVIGLIIYGAALSAGDGLLIASGSELFYETTEAYYSEMTSAVTTCGILALVFLVVAIVAAQFQFDGILGTVCNVVVGALRIVAPLLIMVVLLKFLYGSFTGLGWTFFSDDTLEIYPAAIAVGKQVITGLVFFAIAAIAAIVASFFTLTKKEA